MHTEETESVPARPPGWEPSAEELARHEKRVRDYGAAGATPLPGPLLEAFSDGTRELRCGEKRFVLRPLVPGDFILLQQIGSPLITIVRATALAAGETEEEKTKAILEAYKPRERESEAEANARLDVETVESFFVFTRPPREIRALLAKGRQAFREAAMAEVVDVLPAGEIDALQKMRMVLGAHFASAFATRVEFEADSNGDGSFHSPPAAQTASAGGSNGSAGSSAAALETSNTSSGTLAPRRVSRSKRS